MKAFYPSKYFIALILASLVLGSCAPKPKKSEATLKLFSSFSATGLNMNGGAVIYGQTKDGASSFSRVFKGASEFTVDINYGDWNFAVVTYAGGSGELTGARECGVAQAQISRDQAEVAMSVSPGDCSAAGVRGLRIKPCLNANFTTVRSTKNFGACGGVGGDGGIFSYMIAVKPHDNNLVLPGNLLGPCIEAADFEDPPIYIPTGITGASRAPLIIRGFSGAGCTGVQKTLNIKGSLNDIKIADLFFAQASGGGLIDLAINLDGPGLDTTDPVVTLSTPNNYNDGTDNWINQANEGGYSVNGSCEDGIPVIATINGSPLAESPITCSSGS